MIIIATLTEDIGINLASYLPYLLILIICIYLHSTIFLEFNSPMKNLDFVLFSSYIYLLYLEYIQNEKSDENNVEIETKLRYLGREDELKDFRVYTIDNVLGVSPNFITKVSSIMKVGEINRFIEKEFSNSRTRPINESQDPN